MVVTCSKGSRCLTQLPCIGRYSPLCAPAQGRSNTCRVNCLLSEVWMRQYAQWTLSNSKSNQEHPAKKRQRGKPTAACTPTRLPTPACNSSSQTTR